MVFELNGKFMTTILSDNTAGMILENILLAMEGIKFSKSQASGIVGSENRLESLLRAVRYVLRRRQIVRTEMVLQWC